MAVSAATKDADGRSSSGAEYAKLVEQAKAEALEALRQEQEKIASDRQNIAAERQNMRQTCRGC